MTYDEQYKAVEASYADYRQAIEICSQRHPERAYMPHCDSWVLHELGVCVYCDGYPDLQEARRELRIAFTGAERSFFERPCPATLLRPVERIEQWGGNQPVTAYDVEERDRRWKIMLDLINGEFDPDKDA